MRLQRRENLSAKLQLRFACIQNKIDGNSTDSIKEVDYVTRRFNASSAGLKLGPWGLDLRWDTVLRDFQIGLEP
ncbi:MAG: hypothetical protein QOF24_1599 [Verrucomicrobiota bacterium]|jgi:hypothetical protein